MLNNPDLIELDKITEKIIGCTYQVSNELGVGFLEKVYENALFHELTKNGLVVEKQVSLKVKYDGIVVGDYVADFIVEKSILVELKTVTSLDDTHFAQCLNYLKATGLKLCLLLNFGTKRVQVKRIIN
jgi:GxxExxY protein